MLEGIIDDVDSNGECVWITIDGEVHELVKENLSFDEEDEAICFGTEVAIFLEAA